MIYFITQQDKYVKIGYTQNSPIQRLYNLQIGNPHPLDIYSVIEGNAEIEKALHNQFLSSHIRGEWYHFTKDIIDYIAYAEMRDNATIELSDEVIEAHRKFEALRTYAI